MTPQGVVGKHNGSIAAFVRETWANNIVVWKNAKDGTRIWLRLGNAFQRLLFLCIVYATPQGSPYADNSLFEHICQEIGEAMNLGGVLLARDFNARTGTNIDFIDCSQLADVLLVPHAIKDTLPNNMLERQNRDTVRAGWHRIKRLEVNCDEKYSGHKDAHSDHRPLVLTITQQWQTPRVQKKAIKHLPRFKYDTAKAVEFSRSVQHNIGVWAIPDVLDASDVQTTVNLLQ
ncbi:unnamed protein product [Sphagnum troendelagicum]|uniref:Endonuclease/exonuclease/phosphatase domain-containing protein n=1 Tax=Sphagnum troendelagicum TaxID=128251 RepID=A0ABP0T7U7_9BRYO